MGGRNEAPKAVGTPKIEETERRLRRLVAVAAPPSLLPSVLAGVGLADAYAVLETAIGRVFVAYGREGVSTVRLADDPEAFEAAFRKRFGRSARRVERLPDGLARAIGARLAGERRAGPRLDLRGLSPFERETLAKAATIPRGEVRPYGWLAWEIGRPGAARAVGAALGRNPVPLLIPCHRVVRGDGRPGDYVFGSTAKRTLLAEEGVDPGALAGLAAAGVRFHGSETTRIFCFPTCRNARRIADAHRVPFASVAAAAAAGYRPCKVCRPTAVA